MQLFCHEFITRHDSIWQKKHIDSNDFLLLPLLFLIISDSMIRYFILIFIDIDYDEENHFSTVSSILSHFLESVLISNWRKMWFCPNQSSSLNLHNLTNHELRVPQEIILSTSQRQVLNLSRQIRVFTFICLTNRWKKWTYWADQYIRSRYAKNLRAAIAMEKDSILRHFFSWSVNTSLELFRYNTFNSLFILKINLFRMFCKKNENDEK